MNDISPKRIKNLRWVHFEAKIDQKNAIFAVFTIFGLSADLAEYSAEHYRPILAEYSAEYSVFGRTLENSSYLFVQRKIWEFDEAKRK